MTSKEVKKWICNKNSNHQCVSRTLLTPFPFSEVYVFNYDELSKHVVFGDQNKRILINNL